ncbi:inclusion body family protein [Kitasatospora sp. NPDC088351]|uniref:inclusion body family protein n=1 Tax=unclassified Kitasatospora TaxID=2633591 RepID=UPI00341C8D17
MSEIINVLIAFNADDIIKDYPNPSQKSSDPTPIDEADKYVYMMVKTKNVYSGQTGAKLDISAEVGDLIRWRETTYSFDSEYSVLLYQYEGDSKLLSKPEPTSTEANLPFPTPTPQDSAHFDPQTVTGHYWYANVKASGEGNYHFYFQLIDKKGKPVGYFTWDPYLHIEK